VGAPSGFQLQSSAAPSLAPASDTRKGNKQKKHLEILYPSIFQGDLQKALGQVANGKWFLQESLPTPNFLKCFQKLFFQETSSF